MSWKHMAMWIALVGLVAVIVYLKCRPTTTQPQTCKATSNTYVTSIPPSFQVTNFVGAPITGLLHIPFGSTAHPITITNVSASPVDITKVSFFLSIDNKTVLATEVPKDCQNLGIKSTDCWTGSPRTLGGHESCTVTFGTSTMNGWGKLEVETTVGTIVIGVMTP
jgi:hypothetical protein